MKFNFYKNEIRSTNSITRVLGFIVAFSFILAPLQSVFAERMTSGNYTLQSDAVDFGGGRSTSGSYALEAAAGEIATGDSSSANKKVHAGFEQTDAVSEDATTTPPTTQQTSTGSSGSIPTPVNVINFKATPFTKSIGLSWTYPEGADIVAVRIVKSDKFFPNDISDGEVIFEGNGNSIVDNDAKPGTRYYYALFARNAHGDYSSGVLAQARIPFTNDTTPPVKPGDIFENIPPSPNLDATISALSLLDFDFIQGGRKLESVVGTIPVDGKQNLTIQLAYHKVPEILKTIAITLTDPQDSTKVFTFLLRVNKDKTAYEATIAPLGRSGDYKLDAIILDYKNQGLKRLNGNLHSLILADAQSILGDGDTSMLTLMIVLLVLAFIAVIIFIILERRKKQREALAKKVLWGILLFLVTVTNTVIYIPTLTSTAHAAINKEINYQGKLANSSDDIVADGTYAMEFNLYTASSGGSPIWTETLTGGNEVQVTNGLFSVLLGQVSSLAAVDFNQTLYLGVNIEGDGEMTPRKKIGAVPAAFVADTLDGLDSTQFLRSDATNASGIFTDITITNATITNASTTDITVAGKFYDSTGASGNNGQVLKISGGVPVWGTDLSGSGGGSEINWTYFNGSGTYVSTTTNQVLIGDVATTSNQKLEVIGGTYISGNLGLGTTSPYAKLSVNGKGVFNQDVRANYYTATSTSVASTFPYASSTAITVSGTASTSNLIVSNNATLAAASIGTLNGLLYGTNGAVGTVATSTLNIALSDTTGTLAVNRGGTGLTSYTLGDVLYANGTNSLAGTSTANLKTTLGLNNVENTALSTWAGSTNLTTLGTIVTGVWNGTAIGDAFLTKTGNWTGTFDGQEGSYYLDARNLTNFGTPFYNFFSATTTDALAQGSTNKYYSDTLVNAYIHASSTIAKTYRDNTYTGLQTFGNNISLGGAQLSVGALSYGNLLSYNGTNWVNTSTSSLNIALSDTTGTLPVSKGGTGQTSFGQGWLHSDGTTLTSSTSPTVAYITATSTTATSTFAGNISVAGRVGVGSISSLYEHTTGGLISSAYLRTDNTFVIGTTTITGNSRLVIGNPDTANPRYWDFNSNTGVTYNDDDGRTPFSITADGSFNTGVNILGSVSSRFSTNSTGIGFFGATPVAKPSSTTDLRQALINLGLYTTGGATPLNLNGGALTAGSASIGTLSGLLYGTNGSVGTIATSSLGLATFGYLFPSNATSTLLSFTGGLTSYASTTIGGGTQTTGLTVYGGATTTGNAYFAGNIGVGTTSPWRALSVSGSSDLGNNALAGYFTATSSTASIFPYASTTALTVSALNGLALNTTYNGPLQANAGIVSATTSIGVLYGGTGLTSIASSSLLLGNAQGGYTPYATSSLGLLGSSAIGSGTQGQIPFYNAVGNTLTATSSIFIGQNGNVKIGSPASTPYRLHVTGSYAGDGLLITNAAGVGTALISPQNIAFAPDASRINIFRIFNNNDDIAPIFNIDAAVGTQNSTTTVSGSFKVIPYQNLPQIFDVTTSSGISLLRVNATGATTGNVGIGTTSPFYKLSVEGTSSLGNNALAGYFTATTSTASTFPYASTTMLSATTASTTNLVISGINGTTQCLQANASGVISGTGSACGTGSGGAAYPFSLAGNATSTLTQFNGGLTSYASTTIGAGGQATGLTINGGATTTGNAYFAGKIGISTTTPFATLSVVGGASDPTALAVYGANGAEIGGGVLFQGGTGDTKGGSIEAYAGNKNSVDANGGDIKLRAGFGGVNGVSGKVYIDGGSMNTFQGSVSGGDILLSTVNTGNVGIGTTSPYAKLSVNGQVVGAYFTATTSTASRFPYASTTALTVSGVNGLTVGTLNGILYGTNGAVGTVATSTLNIALSDTTGILAISRGGTGTSTAPTYGKVLLGNALGTYDLVATSSLGLGSGFGSVTSIDASGGTTGLSFTGGPVTTSGTLTLAGILGVANGGTGWANINSGYIPFGNGASALGTSSSFFWDNTNARLGIGTSSPYAKLSVAGNVVAANFIATSTTATSTFAGSVNIGNGALSYDSSTGTTSISYLEAGNMSFAADSGVISWIDMPVTSASANGVVNSYSAGFNGSPLLTIYGVSNGSGSVLNQAVGIGTTSPNWKLSVNGDGSFDGFARASYFTATSTRASTFPYASTTALTVSALNGLALNTTYNGPLQANNGVVSATTSVGVIYGGTGLTSAPSYGNILVGNSSGGYTLTATSSLGLATFGYLFPSNATSTLLSFNGGLTSYASTTIGAGGQATGLTINGGATTTGNAYFAGNIGVGTTTPWRALSVNGSSDLGNNALAGSFTATSTTATSTFKGNITVGSSNIFASGSSLAGGQAPTSLGGERVSASNGSFAWGNVGSGATITASGQGAFAFGKPREGDITASGNGAFAGGYFSNGAADGSVTASGNGSFAFGRNISATTDYATAFGSGFSNTQTNSFQVGYSSTGVAVVPTLTVNATGVGIATTSPWRALSVNGSSDLGNNALAGYFTATTSTASTFPYASTTMVSATTASTTNLIVSSLGGTTQCLQANSAGVISGTGSACGAGGTSYDWVQQSNVFSVNSLTPSTTIPLWIKSTATSTFAGGIESWDKIGAPYFMATSTTATSTFAGGITGPGTFTVQSSSGWVGIGTSNPGAQLGIAGDIMFTNSASRVISIASTSGPTAGRSLTLRGGGASSLGGDVRVIGGNSAATGGSVYVYGALADVTNGNTYLGFDGTNSVASVGVGGPISSASNILSVTGQSYFSGNVGIGTTSPFYKLSVEGTSSLGNNALAGYFTATTSTASTFPYASTTMVSATTASTTNLIISGLPSCSSTSALTTNSSGVVACGAISGSGGAAYPFSLAGNATSTLTQFNGGLTSYASTTIGGGTQTTGLTVYGGATTTGIAYFASNLGIGTTTPYKALSVVGDGYFGGIAGGNIYMESGSGRNVNLGVGASNGVLTITSGSDNNAVTPGVIINTRGYAGGALTTRNLFGIQSNGVDKISVSSAGNLGIGTTSPYAPLSVYGEAVASYFTATTSTASTFPYASTTMVSATTASTTNLVVSGINGTTQCLQASASGVISGTGSACGAGGGGAAFAWTPGTNYGVAVNSTSTPIWFQNGLMASSTAYLTYATTTALTVAGNAYFPGNGIWNSAGFLGIGTTSPYAALSVVGASGVVADKYFATSTTATSTFAGGLDVGQGSLMYDLSTGITSASAFQTGNLNFDTDAGLVSWADLPLSSASSGTIEGYTASLNGSSTISIYGVSAGSGWLQPDYPRVAIGTTTAPSSKFHVFSNGTGTGGTFELTNNASTSLVKVLDNGSFGIGTTSPFATLAVNPVAGVASNQFVVGSSTATNFIIKNNGAVGIGSTTPWRTLDVNGTVAFNNLTQSTGNALCITATKEVTDAGGTTCAPSSARFKENITPMNAGFAVDTLSKLAVVDFDYKEKQEFETNHSYGMIAEDVEKIDKNLVDYGYDGKPLSLHFEKITGLLVQAVQEQQVQIKGLASTTSNLSNVSDSTTSNIDLLTSNVNSTFETLTSNLASTSQTTKTLASALDSTNATVSGIADSISGLTDSITSMNASTSALTLRISSLEDQMSALASSTDVLVKALASSTADLIASSTAQTLASSTSFIASVFESIKELLATTITKIKGVFVGELHVEEKLCVEDVCINKDQLKALLINAGGTSSTTPQMNVSGQNNQNTQPTPPPSTPAPDVIITPENAPATSTPQVVTPPPSEPSNSTPAPAPESSTPAASPEVAPTPAPTPESQSAPAPAPEPAPAPAADPAPAPAPAPAE